jgi:hypothetical protein
LPRLSRAVPCSPFQLLPAQGQRHCLDHHAIGIAFAVEIVEPDDVGEPRTVADGIEERRDDVGHASPVHHRAGQERVVIGGRDEDGGQKRRDGPFLERPPADEPCRRYRLVPGEQQAELGEAGLGDGGECCGMDEDVGVGARDEVVPLRRRPLAG